jgi:hypothetical protein
MSAFEVRAVAPALGHLGPFVTPFGHCPPVAEGASVLLAAAGADDEEKISPERDCHRR